VSDRREAIKAALLTAAIADYDADDGLVIEVYLDSAVDAAIAAMEP